MQKLDAKTTLALPRAELDRARRLARRVPALRVSQLMREALRLGLSALEEDPALLLRPEGGESSLGSSR